MQVQPFRSPGRTSIFLVVAFRRAEKQFCLPLPLLQQPFLHLPYGPIAAIADEASQQITHPARMLFEILNFPSLHLFHYHHFTHTFRYFVHRFTYTADDGPPARMRADLRDQLPDTILAIPFIRLLPSREMANVSFMWLCFCVVTATMFMHGHLSIRFLPVVSQQDHIALLIKAKYIALSVQNPLPYQ